MGKSDIIQAIKAIIPFTILMFLVYLFLSTKFYYPALKDYECCNIYYAQIDGIIHDLKLKKNSYSFSLESNPDVYYKINEIEPFIIDWKDLRQIVKQGHQVIKDSGQNNITFIIENDQSVVVKYHNCCNFMK